MGHPASHVLPGIAALALTLTLPAAASAGAEPAPTLVKINTCPYGYILDPSDTQRCVPANDPWGADNDCPTAGYRKDARGWCVPLNQPPNQPPRSTAPTTRPPAYPR